MAGGFSGAAAEAGHLALKLGSNAADAMSVVAELGEELPFIGPVLNALQAIHEKVETVRSNREELAALKERCTYLTACVVVKCRQSLKPEMDVTPLEDCVEAVWKFVERCSRRGKVSRMLKASTDKDEIAGLNAHVDRLTGDLGLTGIAILQGKAGSILAMLEIISKKQDKLLGNETKPPIKLAQVPNRTPVRKSWHVERRHVINRVLEELDGDGGPRLVGLVGDSGSGKTTASSEIVRSTDARAAFHDGIVWLNVNEGAIQRLPSLMLQLARMVYEDVMGKVERRPTELSDGATYVKQCMERGHGGKGLKCLVVADNVWETEVVSKLLETGMWVLLSTREEDLVTGAKGMAVVVDELSKAEAKSVLRNSAELPPEADLPDDAARLIELCGHVAMDLAFVGRWSTVRGRQDEKAWLSAIETIHAEMTKVGCDPEKDTAKDARTKRRKAIFRAGFEDLAMGSDDVRVPRLYLSLAVMPDGHPFTLKDAAVLLYDGTPSSEDEASVRGVVDVLERWSVLRSAGNTCVMHDAHSSFARESLLDRGDVRRPALGRWVEFISSLKALRSTDRHVLRGLWLAAERVGGDSWEQLRPYAKALVEVDESDVILREYIEAVGTFQATQKDWEGASITWHRLLEVESRELGADHPFVLNSYRDLAHWADQLGNAEEAEEWRRKELEGLPLAVAKVKNQLDGGGANGFDGEGLWSVASTVLRLTPDDIDKAEDLLRRGLRIQPADPGGYDAEFAKTNFYLSLCAREAGRLEEAVELLRRCLAIEEAKLGPEDVQVTRTLHQLGRCVRDAGRPEEAEELLRRCLSIKEAKVGPDDVQVAVTLYQLGRCVHDAGRLEEAEELLRRCLAIEEAKVGPEDVGVASTLYQLGVCVREAGRLEEAEELLKRCLAIEEAKLGPGDVEVAGTLHQLGVCVQETGRLEEAEGLWRRSLRILEIKAGREDAKVATPLYCLGRCIREAGRLEEAEEMFRRCLAIEEVQPGPEGVELAGTLHELGRCVRDAGRFDEAEELLRRCLAIKEAKLGPEDAQMAVTLHELGRCNRDAGRLEEAEELLRRCLAIQETMLVPNDVHVAYTLHQLGMCVREARRLEEAEELLRSSLTIKEAKVGPDDIQVAYTLYQLGVCIRQAGRLEEAEELLRRCLAIKEAKLDLEDTQVAVTLHELGRCVQDAGRLEEAEELLRRSLTIQETTLGPDDIQVAYTLHLLGRCIREAGRLEEAEELLRRCLSIKETKLGPDGIQVAATLYWLGGCVQEAGRLKEGEEMLRRCLSIEEAKLGPEDVGLANMLYQLGVCVQEAGRFEEAEELLRRCLSIEEAKLGPEDVGLAHTLYWLGVCVREAGRLEEAEEKLRRCLAIEEAQPGPEGIDVARPLHQLGVCVREAGRLEEAEGLIRRCLGIVEAKLDPESDNVSNPSDKRTRQLEWLEKAKKGFLEQCLAVEEATLKCKEELSACLREANKFS